MAELLLTKDMKDNTFLHILCKENEKIPYAKLINELIAGLGQNYVAKLLLTRIASLPYLFVHVGKRQWTFVEAKDSDLTPEDCLEYFF